MQTTLTNELIHSTNQYYQKILGFYPKRTRLQTYSKQGWNNFCKALNFNHNSEGIFLTRNLTAYILKDSKNLTLNFFHEYFGHGLYCEYSKNGKFLEKLEKRLEKEEKKEFKRKQFSKQELKEFRKENPIFKLLKKERKKSLNLYENFAIWTEKYLSKIFGFEREFDVKYKGLSKEIKENLEKLLNFQKTNGDLALFYELGFPKYYNKKKIKNLATNLFKEDIKDSRLVLLYGSKKPYSDIDLFIVSSNPLKTLNHSNPWIDIRSNSLEQFEYNLSVFDISIKDPVLKGELIFGDKKYLEQKRKQLREQPITKEAIYYNLIKSKEQRIYSKTYPQNSISKSRGSSYAETYMKNALNLKQGKRFRINKVY